jgi:ATP-dependent protease ClpP protease subunit
MDFDSLGNTMKTYGIKLMKTKKGDFLDILTSTSKQKDRFTHRAGVNIHEFYLSGVIESADEYIEWFDIIRNSGQNDIIKIYINSYGGDLFTAIQFLRVLKETDAAVIVSVEGACMSAATIIFMCADQIEVSEHSMFMFHNYSGGTVGKGGEMIDQLLHERSWSQKMLSDVYEGFLTEDEIGSMLDNKDLWMDGDEVVERLEAKIKAREEAEAEEVKPKRRSRKTKE